MTRNELYDILEYRGIGQTSKNEKMKVCPDNKHRWGDVVTRDGTMGCLHCDSRKKVSDRFSFQLGQAHRMNANYSFRDEY